MDGVKVTYIETRFVTSDAAGFKDLVQRLTGRSTTAVGAAPAPAPAVPHRPRACIAADCGRSTSAAAAAGTPGYYYHASSSSPAVHEPRDSDGCLAPPCLDYTYGVEDLSGLLYGSASKNAQWEHGASYSDYFRC